MRVLARSAFGLTMLIFIAAGAMVLAGQKDRVAASAAWVKTPAAGDKTAMAFVNIDNPTAYDVFFTSGTTDVAGKVELRDRSKGADAKAQAVEFIVVPAYGSLSMDENGVYLMLTELKRPLKTGEMVSVTLTTQDSAKLQFNAAVRNR